MKRRIFLVLLLAVNSYPAVVKWITISGNSANSYIFCMTPTGSDEAYLIHGRQGKLSTHPLNYVTGANNPPEAKLISFSTGTGFDNECYLYPIDSSTVLMVDFAISIVNILTNPAIPRSYTVPSTGSQHSAGFRVRDTDFFFTATTTASAGSRFLYRVLSSSAAAPKRFTLGENTECIGWIPKTNFVIVSLLNQPNRQLFDYTNGFVGSPSAGPQTNTHAKPAGNAEERGFFSPREFQEDLYVVGEHQGRKINVVQWVDGFVKLSRTMSWVPDVFNQLISLAWIPDTNLCLVGSNSVEFSLVDFIRSTTPLQNFILPDSAGGSPQIFVSENKKIFFISDIGYPDSYVYKIVEESSCSKLCRTCDGIYKEKCTSCHPNSVFDASGNACQCKSNHYQATASATIKQCLQCSPLCQECTGGGSKDCSTCKYPSIMDKKSDGSCGCKDGTVLNSPTTCTPCHSSCLTCVLPGEYGCSSCEPFNKYLGPDRRCVACDSPCKTCSGGGTNSCLSCHTDLGYHLSGTSCQKCHASCKTCSGGGPNNCLSCESPKGFYFDPGTSTCQSCDSSCSSCSGAGPNNCNSCDPNNPYYFDPESKSCLPCHLSCKTCLGSSQNQCLSCYLGFFFSSSTCKSCAVEDSINCETAVTIVTEDTLQEVIHEIKITMVPSLVLDHPNPAEITAEVILQKHLKISSKKKNTNHFSPLNLTKKTIEHLQSKTELKITFSDKLSAINTELIRIEVDDPWVYKSAPRTTPERVIYFKKRSYDILIKTQDEEAQIDSMKAAKDIGAFISSSVAVVMVASVLLNLCIRIDISVFAFVKYLNIIEILSSITKVNIKMEPRIQIMIEFLENLKIPQIQQISNLSPIKDSKTGEEDRDAYLRLRRGKRGRFVDTNSDLFIFTGQNYLIVILIFVLFFLMKVIECCVSRPNSKHFLLKIISHGYQILFSTFFFDYQLISFTELAIVDVKRLEHRPAKFSFSWLASVLMVSMTSYEILSGLRLIMTNGLVGGIKLQKKSRKSKKGLQTAGKTVKPLAPNQVLTIEKFSQGLASEAKGVAKYYNLIDCVRCSAILVVVSSLQLLNRSQIVVIVFICVLHFIHILRVILVHEAIFSSNLIKFKSIAQEVCILITVIGLCIFSFKQGSDFSNTAYYSFIELLICISIAGTVLLELLVIIREIFGGITKICCNEKKAQNKINEKGKEKTTTNGMDIDEWMSARAKILDTDGDGGTKEKYKKGKGEDASEAIGTNRPTARRPIFNRNRFIKGKNKHKIYKKLEKKRGRKEEEKLHPAKLRFSRNRNLFKNNAWM